jgi:hypothetical protein
MACDGEPRRSEPAVDAEAKLVRASMALRGIRPSIAEMNRVHDHPKQVSAVIDGWISGDDVDRTMGHLHAELLRTRVEINSVLPSAGPLAEVSASEIQGSMNEAPLRLVREIIRSGRPYSDVVTADFTMVNGILAEMYGLPHDPLGPEWAKVAWGDGRPSAGLLASTDLMQRHMSSDTNMNRGRANFVARTLLCEDLALGDLAVSTVDLTNLEEVGDLVEVEPACLGCHAVLDPLAAEFWGFKRYIIRDEVLDAYAAGCPDPDFCYPLRFYDTANEGRWADYGLRAPGYFDKEAHDLGALGVAVAQDPRFSACATRNFVSWFTQMDRWEVADADLAPLLDVFLDSDLDAGALARAIVDAPVFEERVFATRPEQYASMVEDLTGFRWTVDPDVPGCRTRKAGCWGVTDVMAEDFNGFRTMFGGIDGYDVVEPVHTTTPVKLLVAGQFASEAAGYVVWNDFERPVSERRLLIAVEPDTTDEGAIREQLRHLHLRILGERVAPGSDVISETRALFGAAKSTREGWKLVITGLLRDPRSLYY